MMRSSVKIKIVALAIAQALFCSALVFPQQDATTKQTRPRRVSPVAPTPAQDAATEPAAVEPETDETVAHVSVASLAVSSEPLVRVGLSTSARSVTISTDATLLHATDVAQTFTPLEVARVRLEPRSYTPPPLPSASQTTPDIAQSTSKEEASSTSSAPNEGTARRTTTGRGASGNGATGRDTAARGATETARAARQAENQTANGARSQTTNGAGSQATNGAGRQAAKRAASRGVAGKVRLVSSVSAPVRGAVLYAGSSVPLMNLRAPVTFASTDEARSPLKFNEKAYRGRLEVFANEHGTLTVVNVVGLEDYVRGVVPNELSPGGYPALEALKAQAVAARTYAVSNRGRFSAEGFDLLPTTRSQVYGGRQSEHPLTDRAVEETRGRIATYKGEVINALYTSTCGGRTEDAERIFGSDRAPYLRAHECAAAGREALEAYAIKSQREPSLLRDEAHLASAREAALLAVNGFRPPAARLTDEWLAAPVTLEEVRGLLSVASLLARQRAPVPTSEATRPPAFSSALARAVDGESRGDTLLNKQDVEYLLAFRDADEIPDEHRADVAILLREGHLSLYPDATLRPQKPLTRARALHAVAHLLEARGLLRLQKATARPSGGGALVVRAANTKGGERTLVVGADAYLFRAFGDDLHQTREVLIVGGEPVSYHTNAQGEVDYLEVRPAPNGAAADRFSPYANWMVTLTPAELTSRLARQTGRIGTVVDLRVVERGQSRRALDLAVTGTEGEAHVRGGRIRSALGLREQLFVVERRYDETGRLTHFIFTGRGWGHGVGMCQVGAYGLAREGWSYDKILKNYYTGITLTKLY